MFLASCLYSAEYLTSTQLGSKGRGVGEGPLKDEVEKTSNNIGVCESTQSKVLSTSRD
jgi:hypothetical protein